MEQIFRAAFSCPVERQCQAELKTMKIKFRLQETLKSNDWEKFKTKGWAKKYQLSATKKALISDNMELKVKGNKEHKQQ